MNINRKDPLRPCESHKLGDHGHSCALGRFMMQRQMSKETTNRASIPSPPVINKKDLMDALDAPKVPVIPEKKETNFKAGLIIRPPVLMNFDLEL